MGVTVLPFDANSGAEWKEKKAAFLSSDMGDLTQSGGKWINKSTDILVRVTMAVAAFVASNRQWSLSCLWDKST